MHKLLRYYSQNRLKIWAMILATIFILVVIQVLNNIAKENREKEKEGKETTDNVVSYQNESKTIVTKNKVSEVYKDDFGKIIDEFYTHCINHEPEKAYQLLAPESKKILYETEEKFEELYYKEKFEGNKQYSFQSWTQSADDIYVYQVKIYDNMLATGKKVTEYVEDYVTIVPVKTGYQLNISGYIGRKQIGKRNSNDAISAEISVCDTYMDHQVYTVRLKNNTDQTWILDTRRKTNTTYIEEENTNKYYSYLYEKEEEELILNPKESKEIQIKFNVSYRNNLKLKKLNFMDLVEQNEYEEKNDEVEAKTLTIDL